MAVGKFVRLGVNSRLRAAIHADNVLIGDAIYYLTNEEIHSIEEANKKFQESENDIPLISNYDIIGWAMKLDEISNLLQETNGSSERKRS